MTELRWPTVADEPLRAEVHALVCAVVALGGAVGWLSEPSRAETDGWLLPLLGGGTRCASRVTATDCSRWARSSAGSGSSPGWST